MTDNQNHLSVNTQGIVFDQRVIYQGKEYLANHHTVGVYHPFGQVRGRELLNYCERCTDCRTNLNRDSCLGVQLFSTQSISLAEHHFVGQSG